MDPNNPPTLDHGIPDPETYLPETPDWFWWFLAGGIIIVLLALWWLVRLILQKPKKTKALPNRDFYQPAVKALASLEPQCGDRLVSEIAAQASLIIRTYLAGSRSEPALYETVEEFQARQAILPADANHVLNELNEAKYDQSTANESRSSQLIEESRQCLEKLKTFAPPDEEQKAAVPKLPEPKTASWYQRTVARRALAGLPLGIIMALGGLLGGSYQRRGVGAEIQGNALVWVGLSVSAITLILYMVTRPSKSQR